MNGFFDYGVDCETVQACLGIVKRAAERAARGRPVCLEEVTARSRRLGVRASEARREGFHMTWALRREVERRYMAGQLLRHISEETGVPLPSVKQVTRQLFRAKGSMRCIV